MEAQPQETGSHQENRDDCQHRADVQKVYLLRQSPYSSQRDGDPSDLP